jgi:WSC domain
MKKLIIVTLLLIACTKNQYDTIVLQTPIATPIPSIPYIGCYTDTSTRALPAFLLQSGATVEACITLAKQAGYKYAGVQYGIQCFAGDVLGYTKVDDSECNMPCQTDPSEICGGTWLNSIYSTGL